MSIRTAILDDEPLALDILNDYVAKTASLELVLASTDPFEVLQMVQEGKVDLLLLDIQMPELTGIQFMKIVKEQCRIILTTAYTEYAMDGYEYNVVDYLLKPIPYHRFCKAIDKLTPNEDTPVIGGSDDFIFVKSGYKTLKLLLKDIVYIKSDSDYIAYYLTDGSKVLSLDNLKDLQDKLPGSFYRVHKSYIVNLEHITSIERNRITTCLQNIIPVGDRYKEAFFKRIQS
ncbi:two component transcriptional regulator, LytTR family [Zhouia amylolytica]|uniref:Two component transcriptional regulator, LytTR family n=1 Tax=Zhouia amylolytica TaxID=376730 RepID=A0A1I6UMZ9_9FLAO|nr:LytTR family DNA-binding domain-containing protein [Zhouia amylolytica]SFT02768.1 two component transcriptional regulator, LytTR family [Zhouia amylolytica]